MPVAVDARVFGAFLRIASAAASKSANAFSSAVGGRAPSFRTTFSWTLVGIVGGGSIAWTCQGGDMR